MLDQKTKACELAGRLGEIRNGELTIGNLPISQITERFGTPLYLYSAHTILDQVRKVRAALGPETKLCFSVKANPSLGISQVLARHGLGAEVASIGELLLAQRAGFAPGDTVFAGPGKTNEELEEAVRWSLFSINVESAFELERLAQVAKGVGGTARAGLRVNPVAPVQGARMRMGGGSQQFGIDEEMVPDIAARFRSHPHLRLTGLHVYAGTQIFEVEALLAHCHHVVDVALGLAKDLGYPLEAINLGGGFGIPYFEGTPDFDLTAFSVGYRRVVERCAQEELLAGAQLILELGRYLLAEAGVYVTRVVDVKESRGRTFVITDGGMNHHIMATGNFGQVFRKPYPLAAVERMDAPEQGAVTIAGPCCTPLDIFANQIPFPSVRPGDLIGVFSSGAYGYSASSLAFLSHPTPAEVLVWQGRSHLLRARGPADQVLQGQVPLQLFH